MEEKQLIQTALDCGADKAVLMDTESIVLNPDFRGMCEANQCGMYGRCYMCPPDVGPVDMLMSRIRKYEKGLLYQIISPLEDSFDLEGMVEAKKRLTGVSQRILDAFRSDPAGSTLHLAGGACGLCAK